MAPKKVVPPKSNVKKSNLKKSPVKSITTRSPTEPSPKTPTSFLLTPRPDKPTPCLPTSQPFTFKGHLQPPVDERLFAAKNFLADEDPDRCLDFGEKISEVEELVAHIEKDNAICNSTLFRDVKVKLKVHREWEGLRKTSPYDTGCCEAPVIAPFSTRLISTETAAAFRRERETQGLAIQMRNDHAPFSTDLEDDHGAFLAMMRQDASVDPGEVDQESNLLWRESRAYLWATQDPALIPYWMDPRNGIPTKGLQTTNQSQSNAPNSNTRSEPLSYRSWIPSYVVSTENEINRLLKISGPTSEEFSRLQVLLEPYHPPILQRLRRQEELYLDAMDLGPLSTEQAAVLVDIQNQFNDELSSWLDPLIAKEVRFIIRAAGDPEIIQPGVINIGDGVMSPQHLTTLKDAQFLLNKLLENGRPVLTDQEAASLDSLLQYSLPTDILAIKKQIAQLLSRQGVNEVSDLTEANQLELAKLQKTQRELQLRWEDSLKQSGGAEFRYLRPAEMKRDESNILYLPWDVTAVPQIPMHLRHDLDLPENIQKLQDDVNSFLAQDNEIRDIDNESLYFRRLLEQLVYPDLRDLLTPYFNLKTRNNSEQEQLNESQKQQYHAVAAVVPFLWDAWRRGIGKKITIKMPRPGQPNKTPGLMYCRNPTNKPLNEDLEGYFVRKAAELNRILPLYYYAHDNSTDDEQNILIQLQELCDDLQYPALKRLEELYREADGAEGEQYFAEWNDAFFDWLRSKKGHHIRIIIPNGSIDPDDDPSVVYYRGPVLAQENFLGLSEDIRNTIESIQRSGELTLPADLRSQLPPLLRRLVEANDSLQTVQSQAVLDWHLQAFMTAHSSVKSRSLSTTGSTPSTSRSNSTITLDSSVSEDVARNEEGSLRTPLYSSSTVMKYAQLATDLAQYLPDIRAVEYEINRLLTIFGQDNMPSTQSDSDTSSSVDQLALHNRLIGLLRQFWPDYIYQRWQRAERFRAMFKKLGPDGTQTSVQEYAETMRVYKEEFLAAHNSWFTELISTGVHIQTSATEIYTPNRTVLVFQPEMALRNIGTDNKQAFCIQAPALITDTDEIETSKLVCKISNSSSISITYDDELVQRLAQPQSEINALLKSRAFGSLNWTQSESLLHNLRPFMPPDLVELDNVLRELDEKARHDMLPEHDRWNWYQIWGVWEDKYTSWLDGFRPGEVFIDTEYHGHFEQPGLLRLQIQNPWSLPAYDRPKNLPKHLQYRETILNSLVSRNDLGSGSASLSTSDAALLDQLLAPLFRPTLRHFRCLAQEHIRNICNCVFGNPEDVALTESLISVAQTFLKEVVISSTAERGIRFQEPVPGTYRLIVVDASDRPILPITVQEQENVAQGMVDLFCASYLDASKEEFHDAANSIRTSDRLSQASSHFLRHNISEISSQPILILRNRIQKLVNSMGNRVQDQVQGRKDLEKAMTRLHWKQLMLMHPDQERKILELLGSPTLGARNPALVARRLPGASPRDPPPLVAPPSEETIREVEIEINNLIRAEKAKPIDKDQQRKLNYLLRALLPPRLKILKSRFNVLDAKYLARDGLEIIESLQFADVQEQFDRLFQEWKERITGLGIVLDNWLSTPEAIAEVCSRTWEWEKANIGHSAGNISTLLEDGDVQRCQGIYTAFRSFVEDGCPEETEVDGQIFLRSAPTDIDYQIKQIRERIVTAQATIDDEEQIQFSMVLHTMKAQLMKSYMRWLTSLTPMQRQKLRVRGNYDNSVNFAPKAERRGIQRAAIELSLNLLATNQEQHRPKDRFRMVDLPLPIRLPEREVPLCLPLKPQDRPLEQDPLEYTKKMLAYRRWKDYDYDIARVRSSVDRNGEVPPPDNFNGPMSILSVNDIHAAARIKITDLASIQKALIEAQNTAPRPLLQQLLLLMDEGMNYNGQHDHELYGQVMLTSDGIDLLEEIAGVSWDEEREEYGEVILGVDNTPDDRGRLEEFEEDVAEMADQIPLWSTSPDPDAMDEDGFGLFQQARYDPTIASEKYMAIQEVRQIIGNNLLANSSSAVGISPPWNTGDTTRYLRAMASARRIHIHEDDNGIMCVSRIPLGGHPENKYVVSRAAAPTSAGVFRDSEGKLQVRYDASGRVGPPILQPNKYHYLRQLAFRLGRDTRKNVNVIATAEKTLGERVEEQQTSRFLAETEMENILSSDRSGGPAFTNLVDLPPKDITLQRMAHDLLKVAPDLAQEAGFELTSPHDLTEQQAAILLQMQIIEEVSNNWEFKFPEKEHVWDFAAVRLEKTLRTINGRFIEGRPRRTQFFHMRRFPACCQSIATKTIIKQSGPTIEEKPVETTTAEEVDRSSEKKVRHIKGREPYFSLGESAFERAFLSWRMEQELKDVPEFQAPKKRRSWWQFGKGIKDDDQILRERYPLPKIPTKWIPDSVSIAEKRAHVLELAKKDPMFPNPEILEYFHTPAEIEQIKLQKQWEAYARARQVANDAVEQLTGKSFAQLSQQELKLAYAALGISHASGLFVDEAKNAPAGNMRLRS